MGERTLDVAPHAERRYRRSTFAALWWDRGRLVAVDSRTYRRFSASIQVIALLDQASQPRSRRFFSQHSALPEPLVDKLIDRLLEYGLLVAEGEAELPWFWTLPELLVQRQLRFGGLREDRGGSAPPAFKRFPDAPQLRLPIPRESEDTPLAAVLLERRSVRTYGDRPVSIHDLGVFLFRAARVLEVHGPPQNQRSKRPYPGGGGRHTLELYVLCGNVSGLSQGAYHYDPLGHSLAYIRPRDAQFESTVRSVRAMMGDLPNRSPDVVIIITSVFARMMWKYAALGLATIYRDVGCLLQTMYLVATDLGLAPCAVAGVHDLEAASWLDIDPMDEAQVGCFVLGSSA